MKYIRDVRERFKAAPAFTLTDLRVSLGQKRISPNYLSTLVHHLLARGEIKRIARGVFTFRDEAQVVGFGFTPFYYGLQDALSLHNLWEQETNPVVVTPRKVRSGMRSFEGRNYVVRRIARKMFFGFEMVRYDDFWVPVSDVEKTLIDFAYFRAPLSAEALAAIQERLDREKLKEYLKRCTPRLAARVNLLASGKPRLFTSVGKSRDCRVRSCFQLISKSVLRQHTGKMGISRCKLTAAGLRVR